MTVVILGTLGYWLAGSFVWRARQQRVGRTWTDDADVVAVMGQLSGARLAAWAPLPPLTVALILAALRTP